MVLTLVVQGPGVQESRGPGVEGPDGIPCSGVLPAPSFGHLVIAWTDVRLLPGDTAAEWVRSLPDDEQARFAKYRHAPSAHEFLVGRLLARRWLAALTGTAAAGIALVEGPRGRPAIAAPATSLQFNLAHSGGVVACILSDGREAGVDVEYLDRRPVPADLWHRFCAPSEIADIEAQPLDARQQRFLTYWTLKEAYLKARGLGIAVELADVAFSVTGLHPTVAFRESLDGTPADWAFGMFEAGPRHLISWATPQAPGTPRPAVDIHFVAVDTLDPAS